MNHQALNRREFMKISSFLIGGISTFSLERKLSILASALNLPEFPESERLGRICVGMVDIKSRPDMNAQSVGVLYEDAVVPWLRETVGYWPGRNNQRFVETPDGYIWSAYLQPVRNQTNQVITTLPSYDQEPGMWVEVTVPWADMVLINPPARSHWLQDRIEHDLPPRAFYSQILWVDQIKTDENGQVWYRINERYGNPGDIFWAPGEAFRVLTSEETTPINPEVENKRVVVDVRWKDQYLSCYEGDTEVYFCRISSGVSSGSTPVTPIGSEGFPIWRKLYSVHMAGGTNVQGWDLHGIGWTSLFVGEGVAIHSTFWHNNFGEPMSHGCVNARPEDAKWIFRWTKPEVPFASGDITISGAGSTKVIVLDEE